MLSLVVGPFLVLLAFGTSVQLGGTRPNVAVVRPDVIVEDETLPPIKDMIDGPVRIVAEGPNLEAGMAQLRSGDVDVVIVVPDDPVSYLERHESMRRILR